MVSAETVLQRQCSCGTCAGCKGAEESERTGAQPPASSESVSTRNPTDGEGGDDEITTVDPVDGGAGGTVDGGASGPAPSGDAGSTGAGDAGAAAVAPHCEVLNGPSYNASGNVTVNNSGGRKSAPFKFWANFDPAPPGSAPRCCEVHQFIKWDKKFADANGGPPHSGFESSIGPDTWVEDRDANNKRYGHRSDSFSDPIGGCGDEYQSAGTRDQANGAFYCGRDNPSGPTSLTGQWQFQLKAVDSCTGADKASSQIITVNW
jgi:hypothetical protein